MTLYVEPPTNVRLLLTDGTEVAVSCRFVGWVDGLAQWEVIDPPLGVTWRGLAVEKLPAKTTIVVPQPCPCGHPYVDHDPRGRCMHLCDCAWR